MTASKGSIVLAALIVAKWNRCRRGSPVWRRRSPWPGGEAGEALALVHARSEAGTEQAAAAAIQSAYTLGETKPATAKVIMRRIAPRRACDCISRPAALLRPLLSGGLGFALRAEQEHCQGGEERGNSTVGNGTGNPGIVHQ